jgi:maleylacetate reductase
MAVALTGIRAVDHCVEGICSNEATAFGDASALHGLALLARGLPRVKADPERHAGAARLPARLVAVDGAAGRRRADGREPLASATCWARCSTSRTATPPCIMLPSVMRWNKPANAQRQGAGRAAMGQPGDRGGDVLDAFIRGLGMPRSLGEVKVGAENFDRIASRRWARPGCRATRGRSRDPSRSGRSSSWRRRLLQQKLQKYPQRLDCTPIF